MAREQQMAESLRIYQERILGVQLYVEKNLDGHLTIRNLAKVAKFSEFHFHRIFSQLVGESLWAYIKRLRLERSAALLICTDLPIADIALRIGYETGESYARAFRKHFGLAPTDYRETVRPELVPPKPSGETANLVLPQPTEEDITEMNSRVQVQELKQRQVAFVRHIGPYTQSGIAWQTLLEWLGKRNIAAENKWAIAYDEPGITPADKLRYDACVEVSEEFFPESGVGMQYLAGGQYASIAHRKPIQLIGITYSDIYGRWMPTSGFQPKDHPPLLEVKSALSQMPTNDCWVEIHVPIEPLT